MKTKAIILLFHGANRYEETDLMYKNIIKTFEENFSDYFITDAYSSSAIRAIVKDADYFPTVVSRLEELYSMGVEEVYISPILLLQNRDYMRIFHSIVDFKSKFKVLKYGESLLSIPSDYDNMVSIIEKQFNDNNYTYLFVGHGGKHHSNSAYGMLSYKLYQKLQLQVLNL